MSSVLTVWPHYGVDKTPIRSMSELKEYFGEDGDRCDYTLNWLFGSTSGIHGTYSTLDDIAGEPDEDGYVPTDLTVLVVCPRLVWMRYGEVRVEKADIPWLRKVIGLTLAGIANSQQGNTKAA